MLRFVRSLPLLFILVTQVGVACEVNGQTSRIGCTVTEVIPTTAWTQDLVVREPTLVTGIFDHVTVVGSNQMTLTGTVRWTITAEESSRLVIRGMAQEIVNQGGLVEVRGMVDRIQAVSGQTKIQGTVGQVSGSGQVLVNMVLLLLGNASAVANRVIGCR